MAHRALTCVSPVRVYWPALCQYIDVRCRRCEGCMKMRQWAWTARAAHEQVFAKKTWFATLTYGPIRRRAIFCDASERDREQGPEQRLIAASGAYVSRYNKKLRKAGFAFRYLWVPELHRNGFPHWHGLIHCQDNALTWEALSQAWSPGFSVFKIVRDANAIRYVTKYISKARLGRVRASLYYGEPQPPAEGDGTSATGASPPRL